MIILVVEEQKTVGYQETMEVDVDNISKKKNIWRPIYEGIDASFLEETDIFPQHCLDLCKIFQINLSFYNMKSKYS